MIRAKKNLDIRPKITGKLADAVQRYATAYSVTPTAAVNLLLSQRLQDIKFYKPEQK